MKKSLYSLVVGAALIAVPAGAAAPGSNVASSSYTIGISGFVPVICKARIGATHVPVTQGAVDLGGLNEFCNNANGYDVYADYSSEMVGAKLVVDGKVKNLSASGSVHITHESGPARTTRSIALDLARANSQGGALSFRIVPR